LVLVSWIHRDALVAIALSWTSVAWLFAGLLYTQLIEYWMHRVPMHRGLPYLSNVRWNHLEHHRIFHGANFKTRAADDLHHIAGRYWVFPLLFVAHYAVLVFLLPAHAFILFFLGTVTHYVTFELTHWLTHIEDNAVDRFIARIPVLADIRAYQIEHHRIHHETPELAFNFNPPYLGDRLTGHMPTLEEVPVAQPAPAAVVAMEPVAEAPLGWRRRVVRYGSAAAVGFAIIGAVVIAHGLLTHGKRPLETPEQIV
jgi:hypothetical protein